MQDSILSIYFEVSQLLLTPIVLGMTAISISLLFLVGATLREGIERAIVGKSWRLYLDQVRLRVASPLRWQDKVRYPMHRWIAARCNSPSEIPILLRDAEVRAHKRLTRLQILVRTGPMIGLVGTLIPLGPALDGLSKSDLGELGKHMNIAFTMTVFGILIGAIAYALYVLQRSWSEQDLSDLELIHSISEVDSQLDTEAIHEPKVQTLAS